MIKYSLYQKNPASHYIYIDMVVEDIDSEFLHLQLPSWRPGRYELGNFAKNIKRVDIYNDRNELISYLKLNKDLWKVNTRGLTKIKLTYSYYAAELNAGACYADTLQMYVNPVHCCLAVEGRTNEPHLLEIKVPESYRIVSSLPAEKNILTAADYDELVDSPFIASADIKSEHYSVNGINFHLHLNGECRPDFKKIKKDFESFTKKQIEFWEDFPYDQYHFLFQVLPVKFYHGVEHKKNTVIAIGPGYAINEGATYEDILGVSCHELFHTWNIKTIRPAEMLNYDYTKENYARTGYVYEGFTTYYGDKHLLCSKVFTPQQYFKTLEERLVKHFHNYGRYNLSVADSSWETWLDGYVPGAPYRKTNIYDEGSLIAFMLDILILQATENRKSLRDVCVLLYERFGKKCRGYTEQNITELVNEVSGNDFGDFFKEFVFGAADFENQIVPCFEYLGIKLLKEASAMASENYFGFKCIEQATASRVSLVAPYSPAWKAGLFSGDEVIAVNDIVIRGNMNNWLGYFQKSENIVLTVNSADQIKKLTLENDKKGNNYFFSPKLKLITKPSIEQAAAFEAWCKH